ncbi:hypothetical protein pipiens_016763 [Culex pipiens pipiens]|uniref:ZAD domain-containing protein n=1 Tax=Culex pipiens pipiens TaxID=38569 RepID=A0ABD1CJV9_CULPP
MNLAGEFCSFTNFIEDTRTVQDVIKMLLALEDDPFLPQQICLECSKEPLHVARKNVNQRTMGDQSVCTGPTSRQLGSG